MTEHTDKTTKAQPETVADIVAGLDEIHRQANP